MYKTRVQANARARSEIKSGSSPIKTRKKTFFSLSLKQQPSDVRLDGVGGIRENRVCSKRGMKSRDNVETKTYKLDYIDILYNNVLLESEMGLMDC